MSKTDIVKNYVIKCLKDILKAKKLNHNTESYDIRYFEIMNYLRYNYFSYYIELIKDSEIVSLLNLINWEAV